jgi:hypothetical protein
MTIHSQCQWAQYLPTYPQTFYLSIIGRITPSTIQVINPHEESANTIWRQTILLIQTSWISLFFYLICVPDMRISNIDCSHWFHYGWDGLVSCYSQLKPFLPSAHHHPTDQSTPVTSSKLEKLAAGKWYARELPNDHLRVALCCNKSWKLICDGIKEMETSHIIQAEKQLRQHKFHSASISQTPDMQSIPAGTWHRSQVTSPIYPLEQYFCLMFFALGFRLICQEHSTSPQLLQYFVLPSFALICFIGSQPFDAKENPQQINSNKVQQLDQSLITALFPSEVCLLAGNIFRILGFLLILAPLSAPQLSSTLLFLIVTRAVEIVIIIKTCDCLPEQSSILQLSFSLLVLCLNYSPSASNSILVTSFISKECLHVTSKLCWLIPHSQKQYLSWSLLWLSFLSCFSYHLVSWGRLSSSLTLLFFWEAIKELKEISYAYQMWRLKNKIKG